MKVAPDRPPLESGRSYGALIANWDGQWYRYIVEHGYPAHLPTVHGVVQDNQWAFYPLYPALVKAVTRTGLPFGVAASLVSVAFGALAMCLLYRLLVSRLGAFSASMSVLALCVAPAAVIWQAAYTESLALFLVLAALAGLASRRYSAFLICSLALSLTRPIVLPLAVVAAVHWYARWRRRHVEPFHRVEQIRLALATGVTAASFLVWPLVAAIATGRRDAYFATQRAWLSNDVTGWPNWFVTLLQGSAPALIVLLPSAVAALVFLVVRKPARAWGPELRAWAVIYPLYLLGSTTPTTSVFRYAMLSVVPWWPVPEADQHVRSRRHRWALAMLICVFGVCMQVAWMRWFFVISPAALERP
jgi:MFS family permease